MCNIERGKNLAPSLDSSEWRNYSRRDVLMPEFSKDEVNGEHVLGIKSGGKFQHYGRWICEIPGMKGGNAYNFCIDYFPDNINDEQVSVYSMLTWTAEDGKLLTRDYADGICTSKDGWRKLYKRMTAPEGAYVVRVELALRWSERGSVLWRNPMLFDSEPIMHRNVKVAATFLNRRGNPEDNLTAMLNILDKAGTAGADIAVLSETFYDRGNYFPQTIPGELTGKISGKAREHGFYIILSMNEKDGDCFYNTAVLINRDGEIAGKYRKTHLPLCEAEDGITPGNEIPVFETDFGKIGILTCWDLWFPETARALRVQNAEIIFVPTIGYAPIQSMARAADNGIYVAVAGADGPKPSRIINPEGEILGELDNEKDNVCIREIDLDEKYYIHWCSVGDADGEPHSLYLKERRTDIYRKFISSPDQV